MGAARQPRPSQRRRVICAFAALILIAHVANRADGAIAFWAGAFFWLRLAHAIVYWLGFPFIRTLLFVLGWIAVVAIFFHVVS